MAEFSYIEHLNIPVKYKGSILHSYEYNATVNKINEIVDNLHISYEYHQTVPNFTVTHDPLISQSPGTGVTINNDKQGKLYPITNSSYVITGEHTTLNDDLNNIKEDIINNFTYVCEQIANIDEHVSELSQDTNFRINELYSKINNEILNTITTYNDNLNHDISELHSYVTEKVSEILSLIDSFSFDFSAGSGILIEDKTISTYVDNQTIYVNSYGQLVVNKEVVLAGAETQFKFIDEHGNWVGDMNNVKNYIDNSVNTAYNTLKGDINDIYAYITKFTEYDEYNKDYKLSEDFINMQ